MFSTQGIISANGKKKSPSPEQQRGIEGSLKISEQREKIITTILHYCDDYPDLHTTLEGGSVLALFEGTVNALHKELITLYIKKMESLKGKTLPCGVEKVLIDNAFTKSLQVPNFHPALLLSKGPDDLFTPLLLKEPDECLSSILAQHNDFCQKMYNIELCMSFRPEGNSINLLRSVMTQNLVPEVVDLPTGSPLNSRNMHETYRKYGGVSGSDKTMAILKPSAFYQVTANITTCDEQWHNFVSKDQNFSKMSSAVIYAETAPNLHSRNGATISATHAIAAVRQDADTILLIDDFYISRCHPKSWSELIQSINAHISKNYRLDNGYVWLRFKHLLGVMFDGPISITEHPERISASELDSRLRKLTK